MSWLIQRLLLVYCFRVCSCNAFHLVVKVFMDQSPMLQVYFSPSIMPPCVLFQSEHSKHSATDDEDALFFPSDPLDDLVRSLGQGLARGVRPCNTVQLKDWSLPC